MQRAGAAFGRLLLKTTSTEQRIAAASVARRISGGGAPRNSVEVGPGWSVEAWAQANVRVVSAALSAAGVPHFLMPAMNWLDPVLVMDRASHRVAQGVLKELSGQPGWRLTQHGTRMRRDAHAGAIALETVRATVSCQWWRCVEEPAPRSDGGLYAPRTRVAPKSETPGLFSYVSEAQWLELTKNPLDQGWDPLVEQVAEPIDAVYTWVDGSDPEWIHRKNQTLAGYDPSSVNATALSLARFRNHDELRYSLRSLQMNAPWIRRVYIVTDRQAPEWLVRDHPQVTVVDHRDIFSDASALPVFNSHSIESQLHHIKGLSDRYLYLNDDVFFGRPTTAEQFFGPGGVTKFFPSTSTLDLQPPSSQDLPIVSAGKNNRRIMHQLYGRRITRRMKHTPHPQNRELLQRFEDKHPEVFASVVSSAFRHPSDVSIPAALHPYLALMDGRAHEGKLSYDFFDLGDSQVEARWAKLLVRRDLDVFCINETESSLPSTERVDAALGAVLEQLFPVPSSAERDRTERTPNGSASDKGATHG